VEFDVPLDTLKVISGRVFPGNHLHWYRQRKSTAKNQTNQHRKPK